MTAPFQAVLTDPQQLGRHYRAPNEAVLSKAIDHIDDASRAFIEAATFCLLGTASATGEGDVSPKGGQPGFVRVLDHHRLAIPDLNGNNRLDSLRNIIDNPNIGLLFLVPERGETLRVNGRAWVSVDDELLDSFTDSYRRPASVIGVQISEVFLHCAKCIRRAGLWQPDSWGSEQAVPSSAAIFASHMDLDTDNTEAIEQHMESVYAADLAADRPER